jgi:hypothetical protein
MPAPRTFDRIEIVGFPAPGQQARLLRVIRDSNSGGYELLPEGTDLTDCPFLSARDLEPYEAGTFQLSKIEFDPQTSNHQWFFLNTRLNENDYNFETKYLDEASTKPLLTRTYVLPRSNYAPIAGGTADPVHSGLQLIAQEQVRSDDPVVDSLFVMVRRTYAALPGVTMEGARYGDRISLPREFLSQLETLTEEQKVLPGTAADKGDRVIESVVAPDSDNVSIRKTEKVDPASLPKTVTGYETNRDGQLVTVDKTMALGAQTITPSALVSGTVDPIGGGMSLKEQRTLPGVFDERAVSKVKADTIPAKFKAEYEQEEIAETLVGTSANPTLASDEEQRTEQRVTEHTIRRTRRKKPSTGGLPKSLSGKVKVPQFGGEVASTTETLKTSGSLTAAPDFRTVSAQVSPLGDGKFLEEVVRADEPWPELEGQEHDDVLGIDVQFTEQVVAAGSIPAGVDAEPLDKWRTKLRTLETTAAASTLDGFHVIYPSYERVNLPDKLLAVRGYAESSTDEGNTVVGSLIKGSQWSWNESTNSVAGAEVSYDIEEGFSGPVPAEVHIFFLPMNDVDNDIILTKTDSLPWPIIKPRSHTLVVKSEGVSVATGKAMYENIITRTTTNTGRSLSFSTVRIPPTIHGVISIDIAGVTSAGGATTNINPSSLDATTPAEFPAGRYLLGAEASPYRYGYARISALVVDITSDYV